MAQSAALLGTSVTRAKSGKRLRKADADVPPELSRDRLLACLNGDQQGAKLWALLHQLGTSRRRKVLHALAERPTPPSRKLLSAAVWDEDAAVALAAIAGLRALADGSSAAPLTWLAECSRVERVAEAANGAHAEISAVRLVTTGAPLPAASPAEYWASFIDGDGAQLLMAVRPAGRDRLRFASVAVSDQRGILDASGADAITREEAESLRNAGSRRSEEHSPNPGKDARASRSNASPREPNSPEIGWVRVDGAYCAAVIEAARAIHRRDRRRVPGVWEFWRDDFEASDAGTVPDMDSDIVPESLLRRRLPQTATLIHFEGFRSWLLLGEHLAPFLPAAHQAAGLRGSDREGYLARVVSACLASIIRGRVRRLWHDRLVRQAELWERRGDTIVHELCLSAAWGLSERGGVPADEHPLLRAMTRASLEVAIGI
jgi:hypothetical protein